MRRARRRGQGEPLPSARRQHPHLPPHDRAHGRGHRLDPRRARGARRRRRHARRLHERQRRRALQRQLAAGRRQDGSHRGRHPRALDRALAGADRGRRRQRAALHDDGLERDDARCRRRRRRSRFPLDGVSLLRPRRAGAHVRAAAALAHEPPRPARVAARPWKYLRVDGHDYLFELDADERERANRSPREPARLAALRAEWEAWNATMPPIPDDATVSLGYGARTCRSADERWRRSAWGDGGGKSSPTPGMQGCGDAADPHDLERFVAAQAPVWAKVRAELAAV